MEATASPVTLTVSAKIQAPIEKVWQCWTSPRHIRRWSHAIDTWYTPEAENDLRAGGKFRSRMEAKDGSEGFDFEGVYHRVEEHKYIGYTLGDGRKVEIAFEENDGATDIRESFQAETTHPAEMQQSGWQAILDNFKKYVEERGDDELLQFEITINTRPEKVYTCMLDEQHYREWTAVFNPSSHFKGSWEKGAKILFIGADEKGETGGMVSRIQENIPNRFVSIEHLGLYQNGKEVTSGPEVEGWAGALENYTFRADGEQTRLIVDMDANQEFKDYFTDQWPKALQKLKQICEA